MARLERIYRRTESGVNALLTQDPAVSEEHRRILELIQGDTHWDVIRTLLRRHADYQRLADLEAGGLVVSEAASSGSDLDFTGSFVFQKPAEAATT
jgi:hypothetical protein